MSLLVTGSIGIDTVETPAGRRDNVIGGSAIYFSYAASFFHPVRLVGAVGEDAPKELFNVFQNQDVDTSGLEIRKGSKTFRWHGSYIENLNEAGDVAYRSTFVIAQICWHEPVHIFLGQTLRRR